MAAATRNPSAVRQRIICIPVVVLPAFIEAPNVKIVGAPPWWRGCAGSAWNC